MVPVKVRKYPILVLQTAMTMYRGSVLLDGRERTDCGALGSDGAGGEVGEGGRRRSRRSRYHGGKMTPNGLRGEEVEEEGRERLRLAMTRR